MSEEEIIIGDNLYRILKTFSSYAAIVNNYYFKSSEEYKITETNRYSTYNVKRKDDCMMSITKNNKKDFLTKKQLISFKENEKRFFFHKKNGAKRVILVDDEQDDLFTFRMFLRAYDYNVTAFIDPSIALNYIRDLPDFNNLLIVVDIRMKDLNGFQLYQQIKSIDLTIKIMFVTALDILDELLSIVPGISQDQIIRKPIDEKIFVNTVKKLLK